MMDQAIEKSCDNCKHMDRDNMLCYNLKATNKICNYDFWEPIFESKESETRPAATPEPMSSGNGEIIITEVIRDLLARDEVGQIKYKTSLKTDNGRNALMDAYQEQLDNIMYTKQSIMERIEENKMLILICDLLVESGCSENKNISKSIDLIDEMLKKRNGRD